MIEKNCYDCKFYDDSNIPVTVGCGECRYGPPTATLAIFGRAFPIVSECDWCWRFELDVEQVKQRARI